MNGKKPASGDEGGVAFRQKYLESGLPLRIHFRFSGRGYGEIELNLYSGMPTWPGVVNAS